MGTAKYEFIVNDGEITEAYEIVPLSACSNNSVMYIGGKQIVLAYTGRWQKPAGAGWVGRADIDWARNEIGMVWSKEVEVQKTRNAD